jgi:hypothetical protein
VTEKLRKRFEGAELPVEFPKDARVKEIWQGLNDTQRDAWIKIGQGWVQANTYVRRGEDAVTAARPRVRQGALVASEIIQRLPGI